jgi:hypothetical protein
MLEFDKVFDYSNALIYIDQSLELANARINAFDKKCKELCNISVSCTEALCTEMCDAEFKKKMSKKQRNCWENMKSEIIHVQNLDLNSKNTLLEFYYASNLRSKHPLMIRLPKNVKMGLVKDAEKITKEIQSTSNVTVELLTNALLNKYPAMCGIGRIGHKL